MISKARDQSGEHHDGPGRGECWALGAALAYALYQVFLRVAVREEGLNSYVGATLQALPTLLFCMVVGWLRRRREREDVSALSDWRLIGSLASSGLLLFVVATPMLFAALREGGVLVTSPITGTQVLWGAMLAAVLLREPFTRTMALGMLTSVLGIAVLAAGRSSSIQLSPTWWLAVPLATGAAFCWALSGVLLAYSMRRGVDRFQALGVSTLVGLLAINSLLLVTGDTGLYATTPGKVALSLLSAGLFNAVALISITTALAFTTVASASTLNSLQLALAPLIAWLFLGEDLNLMVAGGILLILAGVVIVQRARSAAEADG